MYRIILPQQAYFVTTTIEGRQWIFAAKGVNGIVRPSTEECQIVLTNFEFYRKKFCFLLHAFVIMPDHLHIVLTVGTQGTISEILRDIKHRTSYEINRHLGRRASLWQQSFWEHAIRNEEDFHEKTNYTHDNPVRAGYVKDIIDWPYSSARWYEGLPSLIRIDPIDAIGEGGGKGSSPTREG